MTIYLKTIAHIFNLLNNFQFEYRKIMEYLKYLTIKYL